jgi:SNF2 family DNA or RNA helicase
MQIKFNVPHDRILFIHQDGYEYKNLMNFPALLKEGPIFYVPAKVHIAYNVITRIQSANNIFRRVAVDKAVLDFMNQPMALKALPQSFKYHTKPLDFQEIALRYIYTVGSGGLLLDPGMGKTKVTLDYISLMKFERSFIVCPKPLLFVWQDEVIKHRPDLTIHVVESTDWDKEWELAKDKNIVCMNYSKATMLKDQLKRIKIDFLHLDEFLIKDPTTVRTQSITDLSKGIPYKCGGSGTLINNSILDVFAPVRFLEPSLVGGNYTNFLNRHTVKNPRDLKMIVAHTKSEEARSILESCCIVMTKEEWLKDLPQKTFKDIYVNLGDDQRKFYSDLSRNYIASIDNMYVEVDNALVMMSKLYQVSNGFVYISEKTEEDSEEVLDLMAGDTKKKKKASPRHTRFFKSQPKIDALLNLINGEAKNKRAIIWFNFSAEYDLISDALTKDGFTFSTIKGGDKAIGKKVREFNADPKIQYLLCQAKSVNYGITVLGTTMEKLENSDFEIFPDISPEVHTQVFYSCNFSLEVYLQQQDRIHRIGQTKECNYYRIFANTPVDQKIRTALDDKMHIRKEMLVDIAEKLKEDTDFLV